ncbi:MAG: hypothetical protein LBC89_00465 [Bacteroidales bacterium]|jgi:hypothetical protein|nr:hypothetical protein [Bacteroidales bacterium]
MTKKMITFLTTLLFCGVVATQNQNDNQGFLDAQFLILDHVQPLTQAERQKIDSIFNVEYAVFPFQNIAFNMAMSQTLSNLNYYKSYYRDEVAKRAWLVYNDDLLYYRQQMQLTEESLDSIKPHLRERGEEIALCELRFFALPAARDTAKEQIKQNYRNKISNIYIKNESIGASYNLGLVLKNREQLNLSEEQIDSIVAAAQIIKQLSADGVITSKKNNRWLYERQFIMQFLNEEQAGKFAVIRNSDNALGYAQKIWEEAKSLQLDYEYDSVQVVQEVFSYQVNKAKIRYIYQNNKKKMQEMEDFLYKETYPRILKQLGVERRKQQSEEDRDKNNLRF